MISVRLFVIILKLMKVSLDLSLILEGKSSNNDYSSEFDDSCLPKSVPYVNANQEN